MRGESCAADVAAIAMTVGHPRAKALVTPAKRKWRQRFSSGSKVLYAG